MYWPGLGSHAGCAGGPGASRRRAQSTADRLNLLGGGEELRAGSADASSSSSPSATTYRCSAAVEAGVGGSKKNRKKSFFGKIFDNRMGFLHGIGFLFDFLWRRHLCQHAGQEVMSSHVLSCPTGAQGRHRSCGGPGQSGGAINASWGYREFLGGVWGPGPPCLALLCPLLTLTLLLSVHLKAVGF